MKTNEIQKPPKKIRLKVQSQGERNQRLLAWQRLIEELPYCKMEKNLNGLTENSGYVNDNDQYFENSVFITSLTADLDYHDSAYYILYFCFLADGTFKIHSSNNLDDVENLNDTIVNILKEFREDKTFFNMLTRDSWEGGYKTVCKILEKVYGEKNFVPKIPKPRKKIFQIDLDELKNNVLAWKSAFEGLGYCEVLTPYDVDYDLSCFLRIIYFTSPEVYKISQGFDLFCGFEGWADTVENQINLHEERIQSDELAKLPQVYRQIEKELYEAWKDFESTPSFTEL